MGGLCNIQVMNVGKTILNHKAILSSIDLVLESGMKYAIVGPNGAGKSSLLKILAGQDREYDGSVFINDINIKSLKPKDKAYYMGYMCQDSPSGLSYSVQELLLNARYSYAGVFKSYTQEDYNVVREVMQSTNIKNFADKNIDSLSGGERQRVWFAFTLAQQSQWLFLDEPISALDIKHQNEFMKVMYSVHKKQKTSIVCVIHDLNLSVLHFDKIIALKDGQIAYCGDADKFLNIKNTETIFGVKPEIITSKNHSQKIAIFY